MRGEDPLIASVKFLEKTMKYHADGVKAVREMEGRGQYLTDFAKKEWDDKKDLGRHCQVLHAGGDSVYVRCLNTQGSNRRLVNFATKTCECGFWQQNGRPCHHVAGAHGNKGIMRLVAPQLLEARAFYEHAWDPIFTVRRFKESLGYTDIIIPAIAYLTPDGITKPPPTKPVRGRPKKMRYRRVGEPGHGARKRKVYKCTWCGSDTHTAPRCNKVAGMFGAPTRN